MPHRTSLLSWALLILCGMVCELLSHNPAAAQLVCPVSLSTLADCNNNGMDDICDVLPWTGLGPAESIGTGSTPTALVAADFDGDGDTDVAVANTSGASVTILLNNGGTFTASTLTVPAEPMGLVAGEFNGDGRTDLAVASAGDNSVTILLNSASGPPAFTLSNPIPVGSRPVALVA